MLKIRSELPPARRRLVSTIAVVVFFALWWLLTLPFLPPSVSLAETTVADAPIPLGQELEESPAEQPQEQFSLKQPRGPRPLIPSYILPSPLAVLQAVVTLHQEQALVRSALRSIYRITAAFILASAVAFPLGLLMGTYPPIRNAIEPITGPLRYLPISAVIPLFIIWFGIGDLQKIAFLFTGVVVYLLPMVIEAVDNVEQVYLDTASTLGARSRQLVLRVLLPGAWPGIFEACRVLYGVGWTYVILAEIVNARYGLGALLMSARRRGHIDWVYALILVVLLLGVGTNYLFVVSGRKLFAWKEGN